MKINVPVIATVAALTVLQAGYPLIRPASAAHPLLALAHIKKAVLDNVGDMVQVHVNAADGTMTVNGQTVPAGQNYVQNGSNGSIQVTAPVTQKSIVGPNGEIGQPSTSTSFTITGTSKFDSSNLTPEQQALLQQGIQKAMQDAIKSGQTSGCSAYINGKPVDPQQVQSLLNSAGINLPISASGQSAPSCLSMQQRAQALQGTANGGQSSQVSTSINGEQVTPQQVQSLLNAAGINLTVSTDPTSH
jgi:hypothetical protein